MLILGGWSPGPLPQLAHTFRREANFIDITSSLHTPPCGLAWCCNPWLAVLLGYLCGLVPWLLGRLWHDNLDRDLGTWARVALTLLLLFVSAVLARVLVAALVRYAVSVGVAQAARAINAHGVDVVVGFSWGGGLLCWMLAQRRWEGPSLLLAPTVHAMGKCACIRPRYRPSFDVPARGAGAVHIFHGRYDGFCPPEQARRGKMYRVVVVAGDLPSREK